MTDEELAGRIVDCLADYRDGSDRDSIRRQVAILRERPEASFCEAGHRARVEWVLGLLAARSGQSAQS